MILMRAPSQKMLQDRREEALHECEFDEARQVLGVYAMDDAMPWSRDSA